MTPFRLAQAGRNGGAILRGCVAAVNAPGGDNVQEFDTIKNARSLLQAIPKSSANDKTKEGYVRVMRQLFDGAMTPKALIEATANTQKISTWFARKAAVTHATRDLLERLLHQQDLTQRVLRGVESDDPRWTDWRRSVEARELNRYRRL